MLMKYKSSQSGSGRERERAPTADECLHRGQSESKWGTPTDVRTHYTQIQQQQECTVLEKKSGPGERSQQRVLTCTHFFFCSRLHLYRIVFVCPWGEIVWCATRYGCASRRKKHKKKQTQREKSTNTHINSAYIKIKKNENKAIEREREEETKTPKNLKLLFGVSVWNCIATITANLQRRISFAREIVCIVATQIQMRTKKNGSSNSNNKNDNQTKKKTKRISKLPKCTKFQNHCNRGNAAESSKKKHAHK